MIIIFKMYFTVVPHITDAIQDWVERVAHTPSNENNKLPDVSVYVYIPASNIVLSLI